MAAKEGRDFIGFEIDPYYLNIAQARANKHLEALTLF